MVVGRHTITCYNQKRLCGRQAPQNTTSTTVLSPSVEMQQPIALARSASLTIRRHLFTSTRMTDLSFCSNEDLPFLHWLKPLPVEDVAIARHLVKSADSKHQSRL